MKSLIFLGVLIAGILVLVLDPHLAADQVVSWVKQNPKYPSAPDLLYDTGRMCQFLQDGDTAIAVYNDLYQQYPDKGELCAAALYYCGEIESGADIKAYRLQAVPYLQIILDQYSDQTAWVVKAQALMTQVNLR